MGLVQIEYQSATKYHPLRMLNDKKKNTDTNSNVQTRGLLAPEIKSCFVLKAITFE